MSLEVADLFATLGLRPDEASWRKGDALIGSIKKGLGFVAGYEAVKKVAESVEGVVALGSSLNDTAQKTGIGVEALQEYGYIAKQNSSSTEEFAQSVVKLSRGLDEATTKGSGPAYEALQRLGISLSDPAFKNSDLDGKISTIAGQLAKLPDGTKKTALAMDLFGRSGAQLIPTLNDIAANGGKLRKEFRDMGGELSGQDAADLDKLGDTLDTAKAQLGALKNQVIIALVPALQSMVEGLLHWVRANRELIKSGIQAVVTGLMYAFRALGVVIEVIAGMFDYLSKHGELLQAVFIAIGTVLGALAVEAAAAWIAAVAPVIAVITAITAVVLIVQDLIKAFTGGKSVIAGVIHWIGDKFNALGRGITRVFEALGRFFSKVADAIKAPFVAIFDWIDAKIEWIADKYHRVVGGLKGALGGAVQFFQDAGQGGRTPAPGASPAEAAAAAVLSPTVAQPQRVVGGAVTHTYQTNVDARQQTMINANGVDPQGVVDIANKQIKAHHDRVWSDADAALGGKDVRP